MNQYGWESNEQGRNNWKQEKWPQALHEWDEIEWSKDKFSKVAD